MTNAGDGAPRRSGQHTEAGATEPTDNTDKCAVPDAQARAKVPAVPRTKGLRRRVLWGLFLLLAGAVGGQAVSWSVNRTLDTRFPVQRIEPQLLWASHIQPAPEQEIERLNVLRRSSGDLKIYTICLLNRGDVAIPCVTFEFQTSLPIIAHSFPQRIQSTDHQGKPIKDELSHFAYRNLARFTLQDITRGQPQWIDFVLPASSRCETFCFIEDKDVPASEWPISEARSGRILPLYYTRIGDEDR